MLAKSLVPTDFYITHAEIKTTFSGPRDLSFIYKRIQTIRGFFLYSSSHSFLLDIYFWTETLCVHLIVSPNLFLNIKL